MAKVTAPLLSFRAGGAIAKTQIYASWKGIPYARRYVVPANPQSTEQTKTRSVFTILTKVWKNLTSDSVAPWLAYATGKPMTDRNAFLKFNIALMRGDTDWQDFIGSPGAGGGVPLASIVATPGAGTISVAATPPTPPTGWTLSKVVAVARKDDDPQTTTLDTIYTQTDATDPYAPAFAALPAGNYIVSAWPVWDTGGGVLAYGASLQATAVVT
jgi:hypothetical protein